MNDIEESWLLDSETENSFVPEIPFEEVSNEQKQAGNIAPAVLPLIPLKNTILFPGIGIPVSLGRKMSIAAAKEAYASNNLVCVVTQREMETEEPALDDLYETGTMARISRLQQMPDKSWTVHFVGLSRCKIVDLVDKSPFLKVEVKHLEYTTKETKKYLALIERIREHALGVINLSPHIPEESLETVGNIKSPNTLMHFVASNLNQPLEIKQQILDMNELMKKGEFVLESLEKELHTLELKDNIEQKVRQEIEKNNREYVLNQQLKVINDELGNKVESEIEKLEGKAATKSWSPEVEEHFRRELSKLQRMGQQSADFSVTLNYLEFMTDLPWGNYSQDNFDIKFVREVLDKDHFGLEDVKKRLIEHLSILKLKGDLKAPILCLVGPPGVGKTSLGRSVASALGREFVRMSLGGLSDEAEIRGHRKTYIGAMAGRILKALKKAGTDNPVILLDEIDKMGRDHRGDPQSALLEVLDPEQNHAFHDNYLDYDYDLSKVLFIATANSLSSIQTALVDRMEVIELSGYSLEEKIEIAQSYLIPEQLTNHGLEAKHMKIKSDVISAIISGYTRESGVRGLNRQMASTMRYVASKVALEEKYDVNIKAADLKEVLGLPHFTRDQYVQSKTDGVAVGLAWTSVGGDILFIEAARSKGKGKLTLTGNLGDVMKESATTALSYLRSHCELIGMKPEQMEESDLHIHVPEGAIPKDGPSAGITMLSAIASSFMQRPIKSYLAMTGEITLRGNVLPVGGIKEKVLAARRAGIKEVLLCEDNRRHVEEIKADYLKGMEFKYVNNMTEVLEYVLGPL
jgi:ATP-dependent Lon protease